MNEPEIVRLKNSVSLGVARFVRDMDENSFLKQVEAEYQAALFDEHVTGTPTLYVNELRYTGATDVEALLLAIKQADTEGRIRIPERTKGVRGLLDRLHRGANG